MRLKRKPRAAIFDLDGVLLDTEPLYTEATQTIAARYGKTFDWELKRQTMGTDARRGARLVIDALQLPMTEDDYLSERVALLRTLFASAPAVPGAEHWLRSLSSHGLPIAVGTSSIAELCAIKWQPHPWLRELEPKVCGDDPDVTARKPEPDIFLVAARRLGVDPGECVVFEDSPAGVQAAKRAGMQVIVLKDPALDAAHFGDADLIVGAYESLTPAVMWLD
jgi:pseudouridine-5'-monophosphatase